MKIHQVVFLLYLSALCPVTAKLNIYTGATGGNGSITCSFSKQYDWKFFCKNDCEGEDILVKTDGAKAVNGRFSAIYKKVSNSGTKSTLSVTITNLKKSDSGRYRCGLGGADAPQSNVDFGVKVVDDPIHGNSRFASTKVEGESNTRGCSGDPVPGGWMFLCRGDCVKEEDILIETNTSDVQSGRYRLQYNEHWLYKLYMTISNLTMSDTGWYRCGYGRALSSVSYEKFPVIVTSDPSSTESPKVTTEEVPAPVSTSSHIPTDPSTTESPKVTTEELPAPVSTHSYIPTVSDPSSTESSTLEGSADDEQDSNFSAGELFPLVLCVAFAGVLQLIVFYLLLYIFMNRRKKIQFN
ncbi:polymeric immunoglobulin receptor-like [Cheilinus undulatus]|uniref:polymeric immunoglobulin receptor-like n=1 Tax=Cheilinus undulatus TaxID=241271 RepID=UPI001BD38D80|nr:polymeric immunoglobulin receptor-like [Cheilinus undulatus]